jgi:hypothetical protein
VSKIVTAIYSNVFPGANRPLIVPSGMQECFQIPFAAEAFLIRAVFSQAGGNTCAASIEILNSKYPYPPGVPQASGTGAADNLPLYRITMPPTGPLTVSAGGILTVADDNVGLGYRNLDGGQANPQQYVYVFINPTTPGSDTAWNVFLQCRKELTH